MITVQFKLCPTPEQEKLLKNATDEYIRCVNMLATKINASSVPLKLSTTSFVAALPSAVKNESLNAAKSVVNKFKKGVFESLPVLKKPVVTWNNQNYSLIDNTLTFPLWMADKSKSQRVTVAAILTEYQTNRLTGKLGSLRITQKSGKWIAQIAVETTPAQPIEQPQLPMGVDLGLKNPAVAVTDSGKTRFFGNGRQNKYMKRRFRSKRMALGKAKKAKVIKKLNNKEQRWMKNQDHKVSREIVNFAQENNISVIRLEQLQNIRKTARTSRKNEKNLHTWSFYRLAMYITYKAALLGISVEFVNPSYTSQTCPVCGQRNHAKDRRYKCTCGYNTHRDRVGAMNIINAPVVSDKRKPA